MALKNDHQVSGLVSNTFCLLQKQLKYDYSFSKRGRDCTPLSNAIHRMFSYQKKNSTIDVLRTLVILHF